MVKNMDCINCGNHLDASKIVNGVIRCEYCGSEFTVARSDNEQSLEYLRAADIALGLCKFDDARTAYGKAAEYDGKEPEAYWGMALADFKVQYLIDKREGKRLQPICHEISKKLFSENENYKKALRFASAEQKERYEARAAEIDYIRKEFYRIEQSGEKYDCFICVKVSAQDSDEYANNDSKVYTVDSKYAFDLYDSLKDAGYLPFFSERVIKNKVGADYEAEILYALHSSPCMIVVCGNEEYLRTPWVQNEYTRYLQLINSNKKDTDSLTIAWFDTPIENLPGRDGALQGFDLKRFGISDDIKKFVAKHKLAAAPKITNRKVYAEIEREKRKAVETQIVKRSLGTYVKSAITVSEQAKLDIARDMLSSRNYEAAFLQCDKLLLTNNSCSDAYWIKFLAENGCNSEIEFIRSSQHVLSFDNFEKAIATGTAKQQSEYYNALYNRAISQCRLYLYSEYISLPDSPQANVVKLTAALYESLLRESAFGESQIKTFEEIIKTVSNIDTYIDMNMGFADRLSELSRGDVAINYYKKVLEVDAANQKAGWQTFVIENGFFGVRDGKLAAYVADERNRAVIENKLFNYGFNELAFDRLFGACISCISSDSRDTVERFDFLLSLISNDKELEYRKCLRKIILKSLSLKIFDVAAYYNDKFIASDKFAHEAYFRRIYIKNDIINPLAFVGNAPDLYNDPDFMTAMEIFAESNQGTKNIYSTFVNSLKTFSRSDAVRYVATYYDLSESALSIGANIVSNVDFAAVADLTGNIYNVYKNISQDLSNNFIPNDNYKIARLGEIFDSYRELIGKANELSGKTKRTANRSTDIFGQTVLTFNDPQIYVKELEKVTATINRINEFINEISEMQPEKVAETYNNFLCGQQKIRKKETVKINNKNRAHIAVLCIPIVPIAVQALFLALGIVNRTWLVTDGMTIWILVTVLCMVCSLAICGFALYLQNKNGSILYRKKSSMIAVAAAFAGAALIVPNFLVGFVFGKLKISTPEQFNAISQLPSTFEYKGGISLINDLDFQGRELNPFYARSIVNIKIYGNEHTIKNFEVNLDQTETTRNYGYIHTRGAGLFNGCSVYNLTVEKGYYNLHGFDIDKCGVILGVCYGCSGSSSEYYAAVSGCSVHNCFVRYDTAEKYIPFVNVISETHRKHT